MSGFRRYGRKPLKQVVKIFHRDSGDILAETQDVSEAGVFVRCAELCNCLAVGDTVDAQLFADNNQVERAQLRVVRLATDGVGCSFE